MGQHGQPNKNAKPQWCDQSPDKTGLRKRIDCYAKKRDFNEGRRKIESMLGDVVVTTYAFPSSERRGTGIFTSPAILSNSLAGQTKMTGEAGPSPTRPPLCGLRPADYFRIHDTMASGNMFV